VDIWRICCTTLPSSQSRLFKMAIAHTEMEAGEGDAIRAPDGDHARDNREDGYEPSKQSASAEETPLLSGGASHTNSAEDGGQTGAHAKWQGDADFGGLPWWKTPSVRNITTRSKKRG
jgi:hypothetical protein